MSIRTPSLFYLWTVPASQLDLVETLFGSFVLNFLANNISNRYSIKSFFSLRNVLGYVIPLILQIAILVLGIAIDIGQHRVIPKVLGRYLHLFVYCCTEEDYHQLEMALDTWRRERHRVNADDKLALNDITDRAWRMRELQSSNLLVRIFKSEGNEIPRRRVFRSVIDFIENHALALLATAPATFAINMLSSDMSNSIQNKSSSVLVSAYLVPALLQITMTVAFRAVGKKMNRKMFEYLQGKVKGWEAQDYENLLSAMECWRKHRVAGLAGDEALEMLVVVLEVGGHQSPLDSGLSSLPRRSDDGAIGAVISVRDSSSGLFEVVEDTAELSGSVTWLQTCEKLVSSNGKYTFVNQGDGNLCIYNKDGESLWSSGTCNKGAGNLCMQSDGDLVLYSTDGGGANPGARMWSSGTASKGRTPHRLVMEDHGHLVIYDANSTRTWASKTGSVRRSLTKSELQCSGSLHCGESLVSPEDKYTFVNQDDGNLVTYGKDGRPTWASGTGPGRLTQGVLKLLADGNLVLFDIDGAGKPVWASMSQGTSRDTGPYKLCMEDDGNLVIYGANSAATWATQTLDTSGLFTSMAGEAEMHSTVTWLQPYDKLVSRNGMYSFVNQRDGDLVIYKRNARSTWSSGTSKRGAGNLYMQRDGNLVLYNTDGVVGTPGEVMWSSGTSGNGTSPHKVTMGDDGNLMIYDGDFKPIWGTNGRSFSKSELQGSGSLHCGESLVSPEDKYTFVNQDDGNLVTYTKDWRPTWASGTGPGRLTQGVLKLLADGNLVLFDIDGAGKPVWASMSQGTSRDTGPYKLCMEDDGNLVIYGANSGATWATQTLDTTSGMFTSVAGKAEMRSTVTWLQPCDKLVSRNGMYSFVNQRDGDLVINKRNAKSTWSSARSSGTSKRGAGNLYMQGDGNLVLYNTDGVVGTPGEEMWSSGTSGNGTGPYKVTMRDDGNLMIYDGDFKPIWGTNGCPEQTIDVLSSGDLLRTNERLVSRNSVYTFVNQEDGNLVVYNRRVATWASNTHNEGVGNLYMQRDGNLVLYHTNTISSAPRAPIWSSGVRKGTVPFRLVMQDDGNLVIYDTADKPVWATNTYGLVHDV